MLLAPPSPTDLPAEALLARLRARRAGLELSDAAGGGPAPAEFIDWLAPRLGRALWEALRPCLEIEAMHLLLLALRHRLGGEPVPAGLLRRPWLAADLAGLIDRPGEPRQVVARLEERLSGTCPFAAGLVAGYLRQGPGWVEQQLAAGVLGQALDRARAPAVRMTVRFLVDVRNLLAVLRHRRWQLRIPPPLLAGGELDAGILRRAWEAADAVQLRQLAGRLGGTAPVDLEPRAVERQLLGALTVRLRRAGRDPLDVGVVVDALWRCRIAARNRALRQACGEEDGLLAVALL